MTAEYAKSKPHRPLRCSIMPGQQQTK